MRYSHEEKADRHLGPHQRRKCLYPFTVCVFPKLLQLIWREELLMFPKPVIDFHKVKTSTNCRSELQRRVRKRDIFVRFEINSRTTARMIVKSSHQNDFTIQIRVIIRSRRNKMTRARKKAVRATMGTPQLPSSLAMIGSVLTRNDVLEFVIESQAA